MKVILNVAENFKPNDKDLLVYDANKGMWTVTNFNAISKDLIKRINELDNTIARQKMRLSNMGDKLIKMLNIIEEVKKND